MYDDLQTALTAHYTMHARERHDNAWGVQAYCAFLFIPGICIAFRLECGHCGVLSGYSLAAEGQRFVMHSHVPGAKLGDDVGLVEQDLCAAHLVVE